MIRLPRPSRLNTETLKDELESNGLDRMTPFYTNGDELIFEAPASLRDRITDVLGRHKGTAKPVPQTPAEARLAALEAWSVGVNEAVDHLIFESLINSLSDDDLLADLGGL